MLIFFSFLQGPLLFDENGDRQGLTQIEQLQGGLEVRVGVYDPTLKRIEWDENHPIYWSGKLKTMMSIWHGNAFCIAGHLWGESYSSPYIPLPG